MNVAIYLRKSRHDLDAKEDTLTNHRNTLLSLAKENRFHIVKVYEEVVSGETISNRPQMIQLLEDVESGAYDAVLVMDLDRLGRGNMIDQGIILETFRHAKTKIITPQKNYDLEDEIDQEYSEFLAFLARKEFNLINRRLIQGRTRWVKEGNFIAPFAPYGYQIKKEGHSRYLVPDPHESKVVELIFHLYADQNMGANRIARYLNNAGLRTRDGRRWQDTSVLSIARNEVYIGRIQYQKRKNTKSKKKGQIRDIRKRDRSEWIDVEGKHQPLVSEELFRRAELVRNEKLTAPVNGKFSMSNPLSGLVKCKNCNLIMTSHRIKRGRHRIRCKRFCGIRTATIEDVEEKLLLDLRKWITQYQITLDESQCKLPPEISTHLIDQIKNEIKSLEAQLEKQYDLLERGVYDEGIFFKRSTSIKKKKKELEEQHTQLERKQQEELDKYHKRNTLIPRFESVLDLYTYAESAEQKNQLLKSILIEVIYEREGNNPFTLTIYPRI